MTDVRRRGARGAEIARPEAASASGASLFAGTGPASAALSSIADLLILVGPDGAVKAAAFGADQALARALNLPRLRNLIELLAPDSVDKGEDLLASARAGDAPRPREVNHLGAAGGPLVPIRYVAVGQGDDVLLVGQSLLPQVELQRQLIDAEQAMERDYNRLRGVEARYRRLFQLAETPMLVVDAGTRKVAEANDASLSRFGLSAARIGGRSLASLFDEHDLGALDELLAAAAGGGEAPGAVLRAAAGEVRFHVRAHYFRQHGDSLILLQARPTDAADGVAAAGRPAVLAAIIEGLPEGFVVTDGEGLVMEANRAFLDLAGLPMAGAAGRSLGQWLGRSPVDFGVVLTSLAEHGAVRGLPSLVRAAFGEEEAIEISAIRLPDPPAPRIGFLIRQERRRRRSAGEAAPDLPRSVEQMKALVGDVPLKQLVREATDVIERMCIEAALELTDDNRASAAEMLGLSRQSLYAKLHRFGLGDLGAEASMADRSL